MVLHFIQHTKKENLLLLKDLSQLWSVSLQAYGRVIKNVYVDELDEIVENSIKTYHGTIKMKTHDSKPGTYYSMLSIMTKTLSSK